MFDSFKYRVIAPFLVIISLSACSGSSTDTNTNLASDPLANPESIPNINTSNNSGVVTLSWLPPTENSNGSALVDLSGYTIYYSTSPSLLNSNTLYVNGANLTSYMIENLDTNSTYYFVITALNSQDVESNFSNVVTKRTWIN